MRKILRFFYANSAAGLSDHAEFLADFKIEKSYFGFNEDSTYSRGQARAIYGFILAYKTTRNEEHLRTAIELADYFINYLPKDLIPFYDFDDPNKDIPKDSSAATMASSALLDVYDITKKEIYKKVAYCILKSLSINYLSTDLKDYQGLIMHGCYNKNRGGYVDSSLIYGDFYFLEALRKIN